MKHQGLSRQICEEIDPDLYPVLSSLDICISCTGRSSESIFRKRDVKEARSVWSDKKSVVFRDGFLIVYWAGHVYLDLEECSKEYCKLLEQ
jgi:hypothetical protein